MLPWFSNEHSNRQVRGSPRSIWRCSPYSPFRTHHFLRLKSEKRKWNCFASSGQRIWRLAPCPPSREATSTSSWSASFWIRTRHSSTCWRQLRRKRSPKSRLAVSASLRSSDRARCPETRSFWAFRRRCVLLSLCSGHFFVSGWRLDSQLTSHLTRLKFRSLSVVLMGWQAVRSPKILPEYAGSQCPIQKMNFTKF